MFFNPSFNVISLQYIYVVHEITLVARALDYIKWVELTPNHCVIASSNYC